jgi:hypothetical protein
MLPWRMLWYIAEPVFSYLALLYHFMYYLALQYGHQNAKASQQATAPTVKSGVLQANVLNAISLTDRRGILPGY